MNKMKVHFLHIGKTGGSAIKHALRDHVETGKYELILHTHKTALTDVPRGEKVFFFLRDPIARFISGFYSRQRKGMPRYHNEWTAVEREVFAVFSTPNHLSSSLAHHDSKHHLLALKAMVTIKHLRKYSKWYVDLDYFSKRQDDILYIGFQESLDDDFDELKTILGLPQSLALPTDDFSAHRNPMDLDKSLEDHAISALNDWYSEDTMFIELCRKLLAKRSQAL